MSTFMLKNSSADFTPLSNVFIDQYMASARGEFVKVYILLLKCTISGEPGVSSDIIAAKLGLLESDVNNALRYWNNEGVIKLIAIDKMANFEIEFINLSQKESTENEKVNLLSALEKNSNKDMLKDIESLLNRPLSNKEIEMYLSWTNELGFSLELILFLIEYCVSKDKRTAGYIEKVALGWHDSGIKSIEDANKYMARFEDKWVKIRSVLEYLGIKNDDIMKPQQDIIEKWLFTYNFPIEVIFRGCDICFERINKANFKYIEGILANWFKLGLKTLKDIDARDDKSQQKSNNFQSKPVNRASNKAMKFTNYSQREYDHESVENELLGWDD
ncbi:MAG: DnaD domain protein [Sarcina sp.]